jgi:cytochrome b561
MKYHLLSRIFHWAMALLIICMIGFGVYIADFIGEDSTNRYTLFDLHKSFGVLALILIAFRIINRFINHPPALPQTIKNYEKILAHLGHFSLYALMLIVPLSGYLMSNSYGFEVKFFGILLPFITSLNIDNAKIFSEVHEISAYILAGLIAIHIIAVVKHRFFDQKENDVLNRML